MRFRTILINTAVFLGLTLGGSMLVNADEFLSAEKIKPLITGKTVHAHHLKKDFEFTVYFDADGKTAHRHQGGETTETTYKFDGDKHCIYWNGKDRCANIRDNGDGTYSRINDKGKEIIKWTKIVNGKNL